MHCNPFSKLLPSFSLWWCKFRATQSVMILKQLLPCFRVMGLDVLEAAESCMPKGALFLLQTLSDCSSSPRTGEAAQRVWDLLSSVGK